MQNYLLLLKNKCYSFYYNVRLNEFSYTYGRFLWYSIKFLKMYATGIMKTEICLIIWFDFRFFFIFVY